MDLDKQSAMIIFELIWTTFKAIVIFKAAGAVVEINSSLLIMNFYQVKLAQICESHSLTWHLP